ncbi:GDP-mannose 4,6-dehydratase [bacterium]|nr:GDP-mannose 4,6-dehydratase [bacterium]
MRILITGGAGFIGSHFSERMISRGHAVTALDNFNDYYDPAVKRRNVRALTERGTDIYRLIEGDILDAAKVRAIFAEQRIDAVVHLAARAGVRPSIQEPALYQRVNVEGTANLLEAAVKHGVGRFCFASSSSVYGANARVPFSENDAVDGPLSPYASSKRAGELLAYTYHALYGLPVHCLRFFTVYGPRQRPDMAIHKFTRLIDEGREIPLFGDGTSRRDYTFVSDIMDGMEKSLERCRGYAIYNLGESRTIELRDLIRLIEERVGRKANIKRLPDQPGDVPVTFADVSKAVRELDYAPKTRIEDGIRTFVDWYRETTGK